MTHPPAGGDADGTAAAQDAVQPWVPGVEALLGHLTRAGVPNVPHPHGERGGARLLDLAQAAWTCVPLARDAHAEHAAAQLEVLATAYGTVTSREIYEAIEPRVRLTLGRGEPGTAKEALRAFQERAAALEALL